MKKIKYVLLLISNNKYLYILYIEKLTKVYLTHKMQTFKIEILREAFFNLIDEDKFIKFTLYAHNRKPLKIKAKIFQLYASPHGLSISFHHVYINRKVCSNLIINVKNIQWIDNPFNQKIFEDLCIKYRKKLAPPEGSRILT